MSLLEDKIWYALKQVYDPEIPVNIADLGMYSWYTILYGQKTG